MRAVLFHNVVDAPTDPFDRALERMHVNAFRRELAAIRERYRIVSHAEAIAALDAGDAAPDTIVLTFDDGFLGVHNVAAPVLAEQGLSATLFVLTEPGGIMRPERLFHFERLEIAFRLSALSSIAMDDVGLGATSLVTPAAKVGTLKAVKRFLKTLAQRDAIATAEAVIARLGVTDAAIADVAAESDRFRKVTVDQCRALEVAGWTIGGHTRTHPSLSHTDDAAMTDEIVGNGRDLAAIGFTHAPFAFPYGGDEHVDARARRMVAEAGFCCAWTTVPGDNDAHTDRYSLRRCSVPALHQRLGLSGNGLQ